VDAAVIVIEVAPPAPGAGHLSALIAACNRASEQASCVLAEQAPEEPPLAVAIVKGEGSQVRVEFGLRRETGSEWHTRKFDFQPHDDELERWRTVGFAIGTLARTTREEPPADEAIAARPEAPRPEPARPAPPKSAPKPDAPEPDRSTRARSGAWIDGLFGAGPALDSGAWRLGGVVRTGLELLPGGPFFNVSTFFSRSVGDASSNLDLQWLGFAAGAGYPLIRSERGLRLEIRLEGSFMRLAVSGWDDRGRTDAGHRWLLGARGGLDGVLPITGWLKIVAGGDVTASAPTDIRIGGERVASAPALGYGMGAGLRLGLR